MAVAVIGVACRLPGSNDRVEQLWPFLESAQSAWSEVPRDRFRAAAFCAEAGAAATAASAPAGGHFLAHDISRFDASFFHIPHAEARAMDPQHRLMLEVAYEALEAAGQPVERLAGSRTSVFVGHFTSDYKEMIYRDPDAAPAYAATGLQTTSLANRISWLWDLRGPSVTLDTACSSSLVALHLACQSLRCGESDLAIVGGTNLLLSPEVFLFFRSQGFLAADGRCKTFDAAADGYGRGEGCVAVVLRRADDAVARGDALRAIVRATGCNQDGHTKAFTLPSGDAQAALIRDVYASAGLDMEDTGYVEAHGTGTQAGDYEEARALSTTLAAARARKGEALWVGSIKSNIGHLEAAAGLAGILKAVVLLEHGKLAPNLHLTCANPRIPFEEWNLRVPTAPIAFPAGPSGARRVSVNSFGYGGTNAHAVLEDAATFLQRTLLPRQSPPPRVDRPFWLLPLTAHDRDALARRRRAIADYVRAAQSRASAAFWARLAWTLAERQSALPWKTAVLASPDGLAAALDLEDDGGALIARPSESTPPPALGFVFTGQGAQWLGMGAELFPYAAFRESVEAADAFLRRSAACPWSVLEALRDRGAASSLNAPEQSQTLCTVLQVALVDLLRSWSVSPTHVVGHSSGEIAAAYCANLIPRTTAWRVAYCRGVACGRVSERGGAMAAVGASCERVQHAIAEDGLQPRVCVACVNSPNNVTVSGNADGVDALVAHFHARGVFARKLRVGVAYHSPHMLPVAEDYLRALHAAGDDPALASPPPPSTCRMHSSVTGQIVQPDDIGPAYWTSNLLAPVQFCQAMRRLEAAGVDTVVEIGPHAALKAPIVECLVRPIPYHPTLVRGCNAVHSMLDLVRHLFVRGYTPDVTAANGLRDAAQPMEPLVDLPRYPWNHTESRWAESRLSYAFRQRASPPGYLLGAPFASMAADEIVWRGTVSARDKSWIADHTISGLTIFPAAGFVTMVVEAALQVLIKPAKRCKGVRITDIHFVAPLIIADHAQVEHTLVLRPHQIAGSNTGASSAAFVISSCTDGKNLQQNCHGTVDMECDHTPFPFSEEGMETAFQRCTVPIEPNRFYNHLNRVGMEYGPAFKNLVQLRTGPCNTSYALIDKPNMDIKPFADEFRLTHPTTLDNVLHPHFALSSENGDWRIGAPMVPVAIDEVFIPLLPVGQEQRSEIEVVCRAACSNGPTFISSIAAVEQFSRSPVVWLSGLRCRAMGQSLKTEGSSTEPMCSTPQWMPLESMLSAQALQIFLTGGTGTETSDAYDAVSGYIELLRHENPRIAVRELLNEGETSIRSRLDAKVVTGLTWSLVLGRDVDQPNIDVSRSNDLLTGHHSADVVWVISLHGDGSCDRLRHGSAVFNAMRLCCLVEPALLPEFRKFLQGSNLVEVTHLPAVGSRDLIVCRAKSSVEQSQRMPDCIVLLQDLNPSAAALRMEASIRDRLAALGCAVSCRTISDHRLKNDVRAQLCISLVEMSRPFLRDMTAAEFDGIKSVILATERLLWVAEHRADASSAIVSGLARVVRNEMPNQAMTTIHVACDALSSEVPSVAAQIVNFVSARITETELMLRDGLLHALRIVPDDDLNSSLQALAAGTWQEITLRDRVWPMELLVESMHDGEMVRFESRPPLDMTALGQDEVEIEVMVTALRCGSLGSVGSAGVVVRVGRNVQTLSEGDRVVVCVTSPCVTDLRVSASLCAVVPDSVTLQTAAKLPVTFGSLSHHLRRMAPTSMVIDSTAAGAAHAACQLGRQLDIPLVILVDSDAEEHLLRQQSCPGRDRILRKTDDASLAAAIKGASSCGDAQVFVGDNVHLMLRWARTQQMSFRAYLHTGDEHSLIGTDLSPFCITQTTLLFLHAERALIETPHTVAESTRQLLARVDEHSFQPAFPDTVVDHGVTQPQVMEGLSSTALLQTISFEPDAVVRVHKSTAQPPIVLDPTGIYVLAGGLGGIGRSLATYLADNGARKLCILSRSGTSRQAAQDCVRALEQRGVQVFVSACDISVNSAVDAAISHCRSQLQGPIRGVIHCAMALHDTLFANMTYQQWKAATAPKVDGTSNLFEAVSGDQLEFFAMLSSFAGVFGNIGQANYAAGGSFQDSFAHIHRGRGIPVTAIDLGIVRGIGAVAEGADIGSLQQWEEVFGLSERNVRTLLAVAIAGERFRMPPSPQIITGIATGHSIEAAGLPWPGYLDLPHFAHMAVHGRPSNEVSDTSKSNGTLRKTTGIEHLIAGSSSLEEAADHVTVDLMKRIAELQHISTHDIDPSRALYSYGVDSLVAIDIVRWAHTQAQSTISMSDVMDSLPITALAEKIAVGSRLIPAELVAK